MHIRILMFFLSILFLLPLVSAGQMNPVFEEEDPFELQLEFGRKTLLEQTNDSTYMPTVIRVVKDGNGYTLNAQIRARGSFRKKNCFYIPLKLKIDPVESAGTPLEGMGKFKVVLPCKIEKDNDDALVKEFIAYKIYEELVPYHFKTRLLNIRWRETGGKRPRIFQVKGFLLEDIDSLAQRYNSYEVKRRIPAMQQDDSTSVGVAYFEYLIANTDYSTRMLHNIKLIFKDGRIIPIPFDFDLSGLVNASYAEVSGAQYLSKQIYEVTARAYKGYLRDEAIMQYTRLHFLDRKETVMETVRAYEKHLDNPRSGKAMQVFLSEFYKIFENDKRYERLILRHARD